MAAFARTVLEKADDAKVERADILCVFQGWLKEEAGDDARMHGARWLVPKLRSACPWAIARKMKGVRYFCGIRLTDEGLKFWFDQAGSAAQSGRGCKGSSAMKTDVNKPWNSRTEEDDEEN